MNGKMRYGSFGLAKNRLVCNVTICIRFLYIVLYYTFLKSFLNLVQIFLIQGSNIWIGAP